MPSSLAKFKVTCTSATALRLKPAAAHIATVALWLTDHQETCAPAAPCRNFTRLPLDKQANIACANALTKDWATAAAAGVVRLRGGQPAVHRCQVHERGAAGRRGPRVWHDSQCWVARLCGRVARESRVRVQANPPSVWRFVSTNSTSQRRTSGQPELVTGARHAPAVCAPAPVEQRRQRRGVVHCVIEGFAMDLPGKVI